jgi:hypothetical protein
MVTLHITTKICLNIWKMTMDTAQQQIGPSQ